MVWSLRVYNYKTQFSHYKKSQQDFKKNKNTDYEAREQKTYNSQIFCIRSRFEGSRFGTWN